MCLCQAYGKSGVPYPSGKCIVCGEPVEESMNESKGPVSVRYTVTVWLTQPLEMDHDNDNPEDWLSRESKRTIERDILKRLTTMDGDADCEVIDAEILNDDEA